VSRLRLFSKQFRKVISAKLDFRFTAFSEVRGSKKLGKVR
jgi:hypothetical protein